MNVRTLLPLLWLLVVPLAVDRPAAAQVPEGIQLAQQTDTVPPALQGQRTSPGPTQLPLEAEPASPVPPAPQPRDPGIMGSIDRAMGSVNAVIAAFFFFDVLFWDPAHRLPLVVLWLVLGAIYFTIKMG
ncbi:MAG: hypothetical protein M3434_03275, partial [Gemmatimonadota bacterium]|nr:hypothetical protein [Gemmatimonadota bacterium]